MGRLMVAWVRRVLFSQMSAYLFFGGLTTLFNLLLFVFFHRFVGLSAWSANTLAWLPSVLFAWWTNRLWVFGACRNPGFVALVRECLTFSLSRLFTGVLDILLIGLTIDVLEWHDLSMKILVGVIVVLLNYVISRFVVFKETKAL